ncbi:hypothetical protein [Streptomyces europaeiscabiei]|uniref:hypothetical protein n=1 Tax=Streptomyces europaeiscabiei TaxID=146819 RepID=UPI0038F71157
MDEHATAQQAEIRKLATSVTGAQFLELLEEILATTADAQGSPDVTSYGVDGSLLHEVVDAKYDGRSETAGEVDGAILHVLRRFAREREERKP